MVLLAELQDAYRCGDIACRTSKAGLDCTNPAPANSSSMSQRDRSLQETITTLDPAETLLAAKRFFSRQNGIYAAFPEQESSSHLTLRGQGGEEIVIGAFPENGRTKVSGSTYLFDQQVARFFATLPPVPVAPVTEVAKP